MSNKNRDLMTKRALEQMSDFPESNRDLMTKLALQYPQQSRFLTCPKCGDLQREKEFCDKCNASLRKKKD